MKIRFGPEPLGRFFLALFKTHITFSLSLDGKIASCFAGWKKYVPIQIVGIREMGA